MRFNTSAMVLGEGSCDCGDPVRPQRFSSCLGREPRIRQRRAKRRVLLRVRFRQLAQGRGRLRILLLPAFAPTPGRVRSYTANARAVFCQPDLYRLTAPAQQRLRKPRTPVTVFQRHLRLKRAPGRPRHLRGGQPQILYLTGRELRGRSCLSWIPLTSCSPLRFVACLRNHRGQHYTTVLLFPEITLSAGAVQSSSNRETQNGFLRLLDMLRPFCLNPSYSI